MSGDGRQPDSLPGAHSSAYVFAVDPGGTIGMAFGIFAYELQDVSCWTETDIREVMKAVSEAVDHGHLVVLVYEDFISSGSLSAAGSQTLKQTGYLQWAGEDLGITVVRHVPQVRKKCLEQARTHPVQPHGAHEVDALAHLLAYERTHL